MLRGNRPRLRRTAWIWLPKYGRLLGLGLLLEVLLVGLFVTVGYLNWYPSRLGAPAEWLDDHLIALARPLLGPDHAPSVLLPGIVYAALLLGIFAAYLLALRMAFRVGAGDLGSLVAVSGFSLLFMTSLLLQPYVLSQDIFSYAYYARIFAHYGSNPYVAVPRDFPFDPLFEAIFWRDQPSNYGPLWTYMTGLLSLLAANDSALTILSFKALSTAFALASIPMVWLTLGRLSPQSRLAGTLLYAWNPLLIVETAGSGHNDAAMAFFLLPAVYLYARGNRLAGLTSLVLSILIKYVTVVLVPMYLILWLREEEGWTSRVKALARGGAVAGGLLVAAYLPVYAGPATFQVASFGSNPLAYVNSPPELLFRELRVWMGEPRELTGLPLHFRGWWVANRGGSVLLWTQADNPERGAISLPPSSALLVVEPPSVDWLHVYEPRLDSFGYVRATEVEPIPPPLSTGGEGTTAAVLKGVNRDPVAQRANLIVRLSLGSLFAAGMAVLTWCVRNLRMMVWGWLALLLLSYCLVQTWFWPWYLIWALVLAALLPRSSVAALVVAFTVMALAMYAQVDAGHIPALSTAYQFRSLALFGGPAVLTGLWWLYRSGRLRPLLLSVRLSRPVTKVALGAMSLLLIGSIAPASLWLAGPAPRPPAASSDYAYTMRWTSEYWRGLDDYNAGRYEAAVSELSRAIRLHPELKDAYRWRYLANLRLQRLDDAIQDLNHLMALEGERPEWLTARGSVYLQKQRFATAVRDHLRAVARMALGQTDEAIADQFRALSLWPHRSSLYRELAQMYATEGNFERALQLYDSAIALDDSDVSAYVGRAAVLRRLGRDAETIGDLRRVLVLSSDQDVRSWAEKSMASHSPRRPVPYAP